MENNIDQNTMDNIKKMVDSGNIAGAISQIPPDLIQNFSKMMSGQNSENKTNTNSNKNFGNNNNSASPSNIKSSNNSENTNYNSSNNNLNGIDANTIKNITAMLGKLDNPGSDPRANLLNSLKPYLRDSKKDKLDNYMNLLNVAKIAEIVNENNRENKK